MVVEEDRIGRGGVTVSLITANSKMADTMSTTPAAGGKIDGGTEAGVVLAAEKGGDVGGAVLAVDLNVEVALHAAGVVAEAVVGARGLDGLGAEADLPLVGSERAALNAATAIGRIKETNAAAGVDGHGRLAVGDEDTIRAHGGVRAVKDGGVALVLPSEGPVVVGDGAGIAALVAESHLEEVDVLAVPAEEGAVAVDPGGLDHMGSDEVVVPGAGAGDGAITDLGGEAVEAVEGLDVGLALSDGSRTPGFLECQ